MTKDLIPDFQQELLDAYVAVVDRETPITGDCGCGLSMDAHSGGMSLLHHDEHIIRATAAEHWRRTE